ncbi:MAG: galactokinase [Bacteroidales bacterium]|jgi:galactokinase|nr:galactokinase [Bacteroidales bacterium]
MDTEKFTDKFYEKYGNRNEKPVLFFSPGRVNLIGEHTDYNGGFVFPCALNYGTYLSVRKIKSNKLKFSTLNFNSDEVAELNGLFVNTGKKWINYPLGVINEFLKKGITIEGMELLYFGDVPNGAGLSSSASIEMVTAVALNELFSAGLSTLELVKMSQKAENEFVGMNCGIMDQFAVGFGRKDHAIYLNCDTLLYENVPIILNDCSLVITNTNKRRGLTDSKYNERRAECDKAVEQLQIYMPIRNLSELTTGEIPLLEKHIQDPVVRQRAKHVISENGRVLEAVKVLKEYNIIRFGELMNESHDSLKEDYEVTGIELDTLVYEGRKLPGVIGTRMTGAGFGGCTVSIVRTKDSARFMKELSVVYTKKTGLVADFYQPEIGNGAGKLDN